MKRTALLSLMLTLGLSGAQAFAYSLDDVQSPDEIQQEVQPEAQVQEAPAEQPLLTIIVDKSPSGKTPTSQTLQAIRHTPDGDEVVFDWKVSTGRETPEIAKSGRSYFSTTPTGQFHIQSMELNHHSGTWDADMPWSMFFKGGVAIHGHVGSVGGRASGGCVRLSVAHAKTIYEYVKSIGPQNVLIIVHNGEDLNF